MGYESWLPSMPQGSTRRFEERGEERTREREELGGWQGRIPAVKKGEKLASHVAGKRPTPRKGIGEIAVYLWRKKREKGRKSDEWKKDGGGSFKAARNLSRDDI